MKTEPRLCHTCQTIFMAQSREVKRGNAKYCSLSCLSSRPRKNEPNVSCAFCELPFYVTSTRLKNSKSGLFFCCRAHKDKAQRIGGIKAIMPKHYGTGQNRIRFRTLALQEHGEFCNRCGYATSLAALEIHHKDRDRSNNTLGNLEVLCANCHSIEHYG